MADEVKQEEKKCEGGKMFSTLLKVLLGIGFLLLAYYLLVGRLWWNHTWLVMKGCAGPFLVLAALITFAIAKE